MINDTNSYNNVSFARAESFLITEQVHSNPLGNAHGGEMVKLMDNVAGITALKHCKGTVVTASIDEVVFHKPIPIGSIVTCIGQLVYVGRSSMQIMTKILVNEIGKDTEPETAITGLFTMVSIDENGRPTRVPELVVMTKEEENLYKLGEKKYKGIKEKRKYS